MAKKKTRAGANMITSVMEQAMADNANIVEASATPAAEPTVDVGAPDDGKPIFENDILVKNQMEMKTEIQYDDVCNPKEELKRLSQENSELKDKLAEYINIKTKLEHENAALQSEYDSCIMKISELSFEVAQLKASLNEIAAESNSNKNSSAQQSTNVPYQAYNNNGYSSWN